MSGLESIALAVAHLEEQRERQEQHMNKDQHEDRSHPNVAGISESTSPPPPPPPPLPQAPMRVVSTDESSTGASSSPQSTKSSNKGLSGTFGYILADPLSWLQKTYDRTPLQPQSVGVITKVESGDVLCGRGGETNHHPGNIQYRLLVKAFQPHYVSAKRREKPLIAKCIVYSVRQVGGRFLKRTNDNEWVDVGNTKAREKTSQALREGAPELRGVKEKSTAVPPPPPRPAPPSAAVAPPFNLTQLHYPPAATVAPAAPIDSQLFSAFLTPLQQALSRGGVVVTPPQQPYTVSQVVIPQPSVAVNKRPLPSIVSSDSHSDSDSISEGITTSITMSRGGPRLKRFKKRVEQEESSV